MDEVLIVRSRLPRAEEEEYKQYRQLQQSLKGDGHISRSILGTHLTGNIGSNDATLHIPNHQVSTLFKGEGTFCLHCNADLTHRMGTNPNDHNPNCRLAVSLAPLLGGFYEDYGDGMKEFGSSSGSIDSGDFRLDSIDIFGDLEAVETFGERSATI